MTRQFSAGGIVYKKDGKKLLWLIRRPAPNDGFKGHLGWNFPRGLVDGKEKLEEAAIREVREEAGVEAIIVAKLPAIKLFFVDKYEQPGGLTMKFITFFLMEWQKNLDKGFGWETAEIKWVGQEEAEKMLAFNNEKKLLREAAKLVKS